MDMTKTHEIFVENLRYYMGKRGYNASELARKSGVTLRQINYMLNFERSPKFQVIEKLSSALSCKPWDLITPQTDSQNRRLLIDASSQLNDDEMRQVIEYMQFLKARTKSD